MCGLRHRSAGLLQIVHGRTRQTPSAAERRRATASLLRNHMLVRPYAAPWLGRVRPPLALSATGSNHGHQQRNVMRWIAAVAAMNPKHTDGAVWNRVS